MFLFLKDLSNNRKIYKCIKCIKCIKMKRKENKSLFLEYFGDTPQLRVFDFLIGNYFFDFPMTEMARASNVSYNSIITFFDEWIKKGILVKTRKVGKSDYYKLNTENNFVGDVMRLNWRLIKSDLGLIGKSKIQVPPAFKH